MQLQDGLLIAELSDVLHVASEFQMAYLPSSVLSVSCAALLLSIGSETDRSSQPFFPPFKLLLLCHLVKWMVKCHGFAQARSGG